MVPYCINLSSLSQPYSLSSISSVENCSNTYRFNTYPLGSTKGSGPSPFAGLAGPSAVAMAAALSQSNSGRDNELSLVLFY